MVYIYINLVYQDQSVCGISTYQFISMANDM